MSEVGKEIGNLPEEENKPSASVPLPKPLFLLISHSDASLAASSFFLFHHIVFDHMTRMYIHGLAASPTENPGSLGCTARQRTAPRSWCDSSLGLGPRVLVSSRTVALPLRTVDVFASIGTTNTWRLDVVLSTGGTGR